VAGPGLIQGLVLCERPDLGTGSAARRESVGRGGALSRNSQEGRHAIFSAVVGRWAVFRSSGFGGLSETGRESGSWGWSAGLPACRLRWAARCSCRTRAHKVRRQEGLFLLVEARDAEERASTWGCWSGCPLCISG